jgi:hypothetical protein
LYYNVFILENKIDAPVFGKICVTSSWKFPSFMSIWRGFPSSE